MIIIGIDLSLTRPAVCAIPSDWDGDMRRVKVRNFDYTKREVPRDDATRGERLARVCHDVLTMARKLGGDEFEVAIESLPTHGAHSLVPLAEAHGVIRYLCSRLGIDIVTAPQATARKLFLGALPKQDAKKTIEKTVQSFNGCGGWTGDECDAFVVANWLCSERGIPFHAAPPPPPKEKKPRAKATKTAEPKAKPKGKTTKAGK